MFRTPSGNSCGAVLTVSGGGFVILSQAPAPVGTDLEMRFTFQGYSAEIQAKARVVRSDEGVMGITFLEELHDIQRLALWLEADFVAGLSDAA